MNNFDDDSNPFAAASNVRQPTMSSVSNQQTNDNNPFSAQNTPTTQPTFPIVQPRSPAAYLPTEERPAHPAPVYAPTPAPAPAPVQQPATTRVDLSGYDKRAAELDAREKRLAERERAATSEGTGDHPNNFPPFPKFCPCKPCFHQDVRLDIPPEFQRWVRLVFYLWLIYILTLFFNVIGALSYMLTAVGASGATTFGLSLVYFVAFVPLSYLFWFRSLYRAFKNDSSVFFMIFFVIDFFFIATNALFAIGFLPGTCGFVGLNYLSTNMVVALMLVAIGVLWAFIGIAAVLLTIKIHGLYRRSGASIERAQKEFQTAFVNNPTVRGAAREVATAGINEALRSDDNERTIY